MKTLDQAIEFMKTWAPCIDGRDNGRFCDFITMAQAAEIGWEPVEGMDEEKWGEPEEWSPAKLLDRLKEDVIFGLQKARGRRGLSSEMMFKCVNMWCHFLENGLHEDYYEDYALDFFLKVADHYGWLSSVPDLDAMPEAEDNTEVEGIANLSASSGSLSRYDSISGLPGEKKDEILELAKPLVQWMETHCHPHCRLVITTDSVDLMESICGASNLMKGNVKESEEAEELEDPFPGEEFYLCYRCKKRQASNADNRKQALKEMKERFPNTDISQMARICDSCAHELLGKGVPFLDGDHRQDNSNN